jgi:peptidoglycan/xylan/chitin deacetylase (PgdA/CDA1 family)
MSGTARFANARVRLKAKLRSAFATLSTVTGVAFLWHTLFARHGVRILAYHGVETSPSNPFSVSVENFEKQIALIASHFDVIDFPTFLRWRKGAYESGRPKILLTFDDGFANNLALAAPILRKYGVPATFFVIASKLDGRDRRFMTAGDLLSLLESDLFRIGSHSLNHLSVARITEEKKNEEIGGSKSLLETTIGRDISYFCYPYGTFSDFDQRSLSLLEQYGYSLACTSINGINFKGTNLFRLRRAKVEWADDNRTFSRILRGAMDGWIIVDFFFRLLQRPRAVRFDRDDNLRPRAN